MKNIFNYNIVVGIKGGDTEMKIKLYDSKTGSKSFEAIYILEVCNKISFKR